MDFLSPLQSGSSDQTGTLLAFRISQNQKRKLGVEQAATKAAESEQEQHVKSERLKLSEK
jgi:hypothetical protein